MTTAARRTYAPRPADIHREWRVIDASGRPIGRLASEVAQILKGKDKVTYAPNADTGDFVIVVNAAKVGYTGAKFTDKTYYSHSLYPGGLKAVTLERMLAKHPRRVIEYAVWGMLPKGPLGRSLMRRLKVYAEATHPHAAQNAQSAGPVTAGSPKKVARPVHKAKTATPAVPAPPAAVTKAAAPRRRPRATARRVAKPQEESK